MIDNTYYGNKPSIENVLLSGLAFVKIPYDITEVSPGVYSWREISVRKRDFNYGGVVSALIGLEYSNSQMTAIINNYLLDPNDETSLTEFKAMQDCRKRAKMIAGQIFSENGI